MTLPLRSIPLSNYDSSPVQYTWNETLATVYLELRAVQEETLPLCGLEDTN